MSSAYPWGYTIYQRITREGIAHVTSKTKRGIALLILAASVAVGTIGCAPQEGVENVDAARTAELAEAGVRIVDVRTPSEFEAGHIPGAENVPVNTIAEVAAGWDKAEPVLIYCAIGSRSASTVQHLVQQGFEQIYHFNAGMVAWTGETQSGPVAVAPPAPSPTGSKVMYEFFTDW